MGAYKQLLASDVIVTPFEVSKGFTFYVTESITEIRIEGPGGGKTDINLPIPYFTETPNQLIPYPGEGLDRLLGENIVDYSFDTSNDPTTGLYILPSPFPSQYWLYAEGYPSRSQYRRLVYNSIKQLYYTNYSESVYSDPVNNPVLVPGRDEEGNRYIGSSSSPRFDNYLQTDLTYPRFFPNNTGSYIAALSIPSGIYGDYVQPGSFIMSFTSGGFGGTFYDDSQGNIFTGSILVGNITYTHGIVTLTGNKALYTTPFAIGSIYSTAVYGVSVYGTTISLSDWTKIIFAFANSTNFTCSFSSSYTIQDTQYKCTVRENEFNLSLNPSLTSGSYTTDSNSGLMYGFATESYFSPYITTVGLYDEQQNLLAIGKLSQPLPSSPTTDTTILINIDR
jgi:hypothetical protein